MAEPTGSHASKKGRILNRKVRPIWPSLAVLLISIYLFLIFSNIG